MSRLVDVKFLFGDTRSIFDLIFGLCYLFAVKNKNEKNEKNKKPFGRWFESNSVGWK